MICEQYTHCCHGVNLANRETAVSSSAVDLEKLRQLSGDGYKRRSEPAANGKNYKYMLILYFDGCPTDKMTVSNFASTSTLCLP